MTVSILILSYAKIFLSVYLYKCTEESLELQTLKGVLCILCTFFSA